MNHKISCGSTKRKCEAYREISKQSKTYDQMQDWKNWSGLKEGAVITVCMHKYESALVKKLIYVSLCTGNGIKNNSEHFGM